MVTADQPNGCDQAPFEIRRGAPATDNGDGAFWISCITFGNDCALQIVSFTDNVQRSL